MKATNFYSIFDIQRACRLISEFIEHKSYMDYSNDVLLRSGIERQLEIIGEAVNQLSRIDETTVGKIDQYRQIVDFRNVLIPGYSRVNNEAVWGIITTRLPTLADQIDQLLREGGDA